MKKMYTTFLKKVDYPKRSTFGAVLKSSLQLPRKESFWGCPSLILQKKPGTYFDGTIKKNENSKY